MLMIVKGRRRRRRREKNPTSYRLGPISPSAASPRPAKVPCFHWRRNNCKLLPHSSCERSPWLYDGSFPTQFHTSVRYPPGPLKTPPNTFKGTGASRAEHSHSRSYRQLMTAVTSLFPGFLFRKNDFRLRLQNKKTTLGLRICPKMMGRCLQRRPVMKTAFIRSSLRCYGALPFLAVSQLSVAPNGSDGLVLSKCLTAAPLPLRCMWTNIIGRTASASSTRKNTNNAEQEQEVAGNERSSLRGTWWSHSIPHIHSTNVHTFLPYLFRVQISFVFVFFL